MFGWIGSTMCGLGSEVWLHCPVLFLEIDEV